MITEISIQRGSGNVFADLGYDDPEEMSAKAEIVRNIDKTITRLQIDHSEVAKLIGIKQSEVYDLIIGRFLHLPKDQLSQFLTKLTTMTDSNHPKEEEVLKLQEIVENGILNGEWTFDFKNEGSLEEFYLSTKGNAKNNSKHFLIDIWIKDWTDNSEAYLSLTENDTTILKIYHSSLAWEDVDDKGKELVEICLKRWKKAKEERVAIVQNNLLSNSAEKLPQSTTITKLDKDEFQYCSRLIHEYILDGETQSLVKGELKQLKEVYKSGTSNTSVAHLCNLITNRIFGYILNDSSVQKIIDGSTLIKLHIKDKPLEKLSLEDLIYIFYIGKIIDIEAYQLANLIRHYGQTELEVIDPIPSITVNCLNVICWKIIQWYNKNNNKL